MWKLAVGFALFAALAIFVLMQGGDNINLGGETHGMDAPHDTPAAASAPVPAASQ